MSRTLKRLLHWLGNVMALFGVAFVVYRLSIYREQLDAFHAWWLILGLVLLSAASGILLGGGWWFLLRRQLRAAAPSLPWAILAYGVSQLAKYLPGNIFHFASRQALGMSAGIPAGVLLGSVFLELLTIVSVACGFALLALPLLGAVPYPLAGGAFVLALLAIPAALWRMRGADFSCAWLAYSLYLGLAAAVFCVLLFSVKGGSAAATPTFILACAGAYVLAWLAGLVIPGVPAGIGVREFVLLFLLKGTVGEADLLLAVLLGRVVTTAGDCLYYLVSVLGMAALKDIHHAPR